MKPSSRSKALTRTFIGVALASIVAAVVYAQTPNTSKPPDYLHMKVEKTVDDVWFNTNVGSFKILPRGDVMPSGTLSMSFTGSVLISELNGTIIPEGNVRKEYDNTKHGKQVWFGTGKLTIKGSFMGVQWFGRNLTAKFSGNGYMRLYGEFDKNLETGYYWFNPAEKRDWGNYGASFGVPETKMGGAPTDIKTRQEFEKGKKKGTGG